MTPQDGGIQNNLGRDRDQISLIAAESDLREADPVPDRDYGLTRNARKAYFNGIKDNGTKRGRISRLA